jgi:hydroxyacylglutathione hydrolase
MGEIIQHTINTPYMVGPVHCYTAWLGDELVLFDTGPPVVEAQRFLAERIDLGRLRHVVITHCHIDHYGLAWWLEENTEATIYLPYRDSLKIAHHEQRMAGMYQLLASYGFPREYLEELRRVFLSGALFPPFPKKYLVVEEDLPARLGIQVTPCPGHSQSDLVYSGEEWAITGDTLLRGIFQSPLLDLDLAGEGRFQNYQAYCTSIVRLAGLSGKTILPGHRQGIASVAATLQFYLSKMLLRAGQLLPHRTEKNLPKLIERLVGGRMEDVFHIYLKASEIIFMQDFLDQPELLRSALEEIGIFDGVAEAYHLAVGASPGGEGIRPN